MRGGFSVVRGDASASGDLSGNGSQDNFYDGPNAVAFSPSDGLMATANKYNGGSGGRAGTIPVWAVGPSVATISSAADNQSVYQYTTHVTSFG